MQGSATVTMSAPADKVWNLIADVRNTGRFSPEVFESEWLDGATGLCLGWLLALYVEAVGMLPALARVLRTTSTPALLVGLEAA